MTKSRQSHFSDVALPLFGPVSAQKKPATKQPSYIKGHRKRLRERFQSGGPTALPDYELLELVLFRAMRQQDVKPLAHRLLNTFGDFNRVISAPKVAFWRSPVLGKPSSWNSRLSRLRPIAWHARAS